MGAMKLKKSTSPWALILPEIPPVPFAELLGFESIAMTVSRNARLHLHGRGEPMLTALLLTPALGSMAIFVMMAAILAFRPKGLFPAHG